MKILLGLLLTIPCFANELYCNHAKICEFLNRTVTSKKLDIKIIFSDDEKLLSSVKYFVAPPHYLSPKTSEVVKSREDKSFRTFRIYLPSNITKSYKLSSANPVDELAYFWFYPDIHCFIENTFLEFLSELKFKLSQKDCSTAIKKVQNLKMNLAKLRPLNIESELIQLKPLFNIKGITFNEQEKINFYIGSKDSNVKYTIDTKTLNEFDLFDLLYNKVELWVQEKVKK